MTTKRVNGLFSLLVRDNAEGIAVALDLVSYALNNLGDDSIEALGAQVPSDARHLVAFYDRFFRKQGSFPIYERDEV